MNTRPCNARKPGGIDRCIEPWRHDKGPRPTKHSGGDGTTWGVEWAEAPAARNSLKRQSDTEALGAAYREGRKDGRIDCQFRSHGEAYCEAVFAGLGRCTVTFTREDDARSGLDYAHITRRSQAQGYRSGKGGQNDRDFVLLCRGHHEEYDGSVPRFGERAS